MQKRSLVILLLVAFSFSSVLAQDRFIIGAGDANNTVIDTTTGLMWERSPPYKTVSWQAAVSYCDGLDGSNGLEGYSDWRLPSLSESLSLVDYRFYNPSFSNTSGAGKWSDGNPFYLELSLPLVWTSTPSSSIFGYAWCIDIKYGDNGAYSKSDSTKAYAWCVRENISSSEKEIVYVNNTIYLNNTNCPICENNCSAGKEIIYINNTVNNTVYTNNCTEKNLSVKTDIQDNSPISGQTNEAVLDEDQNLGLVIAFVVMGLIIVCLTVLTFYLYNKSKSE